MLIVLGTAILIIVMYLIRYHQHDVRTEIRFIENDTITLPVITLCHLNTVLNSYYCYQNKSIYNTKRHCNIEMKKNASHIEYYPETNEVVSTYVGRDCHAFNVNGTLAVSGKTEYITLEYYYYGWYWSKNIYMILQSPEEFAASKIVGHATYMNSYRRPVGGNSYDVFIEKTKISRKQSPFPSKCTNEHVSTNPFSSIYTKKSCQEKCAMDYMYSECKDVVDIWKPYLAKKEEPFENSTEYKSREDCLRKVMDQVRQRIPKNCTCPLSCDEKRLNCEINYVTTPTENGGIKLFLYYKEKMVTSINEVEDYPIEDLLGSLGGILGLCIGMSVISLVELIVYLVFFTLDVFR